MLEAELPWPGKAKAALKGAQPLQHRGACPALPSLAAQWPRCGAGPLSLPCPARSPPPGSAPAGCGPAVKPPRHVLPPQEAELPENKGERPGPAVRGHRARQRQSGSTEVPGRAGTRPPHGTPARERPRARFFRSGGRAACLPLTFPTRVTPRKCCAALYVKAAPRVFSPRRAGGTPREGGGLPRHTSPPRRRVRPRVATGGGRPPAALKMAPRHTQDGAGGRGRRPRSRWPPARRREMAAGAQARRGASGGAA